MDENITELTKEETANTIANDTNNSTVTVKNKEKFKLGGFLLAIVPLIVASGVNILLSFVFGIIASANYTANLIAAGQPTDNIDMVEMNNAIIQKLAEMAPTMQIVMEILFLFIFGLWYKSLIRREKKVEVKKVLTAKNVGLIVLASILAEFAAQFEVSVYSPLFPGSLENLENSMNMIGASEISILSVLTIAVMAPIAEELIFRGVSLKLLQKSGVGAYAAIILQGVFFGIFHMNLIQGIYAAELGILMGIVAYKCKSIYPSVVMHVVINFSAVILGGINIGIDVNLFFCIVLFVVTAALAVFSTLKVTPKEEAAA